MGRKGRESRKEPLMIRFTESMLCHTKSPWAGELFKLTSWQRKWLQDIFGTFNEDGTRQYRTVYIELPRKNGKSELGAAIALYMLFADNEFGAEVYSAAGNIEQASHVFKVAEAMVRFQDELKSRCQVYKTQRRIVIPETNSVYRVLPAEADTQFGLNASAIIFDELHVQPNRKLWDALTTSSGTRRQPLVVAITTAGFDRESICWEVHDYARQVMEGKVDDPTFYPVIMAAPPDADWTDEEVLKECNPATHGDLAFRNLDEIKSLCERAKALPALENNFRRLYLNQWTAQETRFIPMDKWDACDKPLNMEVLGKKTFYAGVDLAAVSDLTALALVHKDAEGFYHAMCHAWIPQKRIDEETMRGRPQYSLWQKEGYLTGVPGDSMDYQYIIEKAKELSKDYYIAEIGYDPWNASQFVQEMERLGYLMIMMRQGWMTFNEPTKSLLRAVLNGKIIHGGNPILRWNMDNLVVTMDARENVAPDKKTAKQKIDLAVALIMAMSRADVHGPDGSVYDDNPLILI